MTKPRTGQSGNWDRERADRLQEDVERMQKDVERLERWKFEACEVMSGLRELGKALGLGLGVQITGPAALAEVARLTAEREWFKDRFPCDGVCVDAPEEACSRHGRNPADLWRIIGEVAAERDALAAQVARVESLAEDWRYKGQFGWGPWQIGEGPDPEGYVMDHCASALRAALSGSGADTTDTQPTDQEVSDE